ncbi:DUF3429 domain-containing protein [Pseudomonas sp. SK]|uniref:DUF3429 domain-containing protein n=1 Tax=Pseudomonas sp. SK TaxID=2729423 RepID=UPI002113ED09|nr:DUF3429 domain-containing protein [Pseudomonas sp. SK]
MTGIQMSGSSTLLPRRFAILGYGGLLPFVGLMLLVVFVPEYRALWAMMLVNYGAVILSFVGALHWGFAMALPALPAEQRRKRLMWSVVPALLGWVSTLLPVSLGCLMLLGGFALHYWQDRKLLQVVPGWYLPMRLQLTTVASICLLLGAMALTSDF